MTMSIVCVSGHHLSLTCRKLLIVLTSSFFVYYTHAASFDEPHGHRGKATPYQPGDPKIQLDSRARKILDLGNPYQTQIIQGASGRALCVQDIAAPPKQVWSKILDLDNYSNYISMLSYSKNYHVEETREKSTIFTQMTIRLPLGFKITYFIQHHYFPALKSLTWALDYNKKSDLDDTVGFWYVLEHPYKKNWSRVFYSVELRIFDWIPGYIKDIISRKALSEATGWVKSESEKGNAQDKGKKKKRNIIDFFRKKICLPCIIRKLWFWKRENENIHDGDSTCNGKACSAARELSSVDIPIEKHSQKMGLEQTGYVVLLISFSFFILGLVLERLS